jgi:glycosyltransferase involved in cell wall biosynthesis
MKKPLVRIITPVYNGERFIGAAIQSVLTQTFQDWELVIVDDGSTDLTSNVIKQFSDNRITCIRQNNAGDEAARERGFQDCETEFVARLDADDIMLPERLEKQVQYLRDHPEVGAVGGQIMYISENGNKIGFRSDWPLEHEEIVHNFLSLRGSISNSTIMVRRDIQEKFPYKSLGGPGADVGFILGFTAFSKLANLPFVVNYVRIHNQSLQSSYNQIERLKRTHYSLVCYHSYISNKPQPLWEDFRKELEHRPLRKKIIERRELLIGKLARKAMWYRLNRSLFPHAISIMGLLFIITPIRTIKRSLKWLLTTPLRRKTKFNSRML